MAKWRLLMTFKKLNKRNQKNFDCASNFLHPAGYGLLAIHSEYKGNFSTEMLRFPIQYEWLFYLYI